MIETAAEAAKTQTSTWPKSGADRRAGEETSERWNKKISKRASDGFGKINFSEKKIRIRIFKNSNKYLEENEGKSKKPNFRFLGRVITTLSEHVVIGLESSE